MDDADEALALRARSGEREAFASLVRRHQDRVFGFLLRMLGNREDAMDLTQDAFLKAWNALPGWRPEARFTTWLFQIARNAALDLLRRRGSLQFVSLDDPPQQGDAQDPRDAGPLPEERLADRQRIDLLQRALAALPAGYREILLLRELENMSYTEIAATLGIQEGTVKSRLARARAAVLDNYRHHAGRSPDDLSA
ncbi:MAG: sigma-70 family RNA polymerase sigma factor [Rhodocyclaceae bacterium]|nr:sigma-70 family RNA polymerase sigma factor [Rhodocyclaceae bacterium]